VERERGFVVHTADYRGEANLNVNGEVALTATREVLDAIAAAAGAPSRWLVALGYAGWGAGQLEAEIKHNVWLTCEPDGELIFDHDYEGKWGRALAKIGVDPKFLSAEAGRA
jgi:putative transcriptional regulator